MLSPRRADGSLEHGLSQPRLLDDNVALATDLIRAARATRSGLDLLGGVVEATRGVRPGNLVVVSNGLGTTGAFDLRLVGWGADPNTVARQLAGAEQLPDLRGWNVLFTGQGGGTGASRTSRGGVAER